jgi:hypothetical protein
MHRSSGQDPALSISNPSPRYEGETLNADSTSTPLLATERDPFEVVGNWTVCAWPLGTGVWVQTRSPEIAQKLSWLTRNPRPRLVAWSVHGEYLRTYEVNKSLEWAAAWINEVLSGSGTRKSRKDLSTNSEASNSHFDVGAVLIPAEGQDSGHPDSSDYNGSKTGVCR